MKMWRETVCVVAKERVRQRRRSDCALVATVSKKITYSTEKGESVCRAKYLCRDSVNKYHTVYAHLLSQNNRQPNKQSWLLEGSYCQLTRDECRDYLFQEAVCWVSRISDSTGSLVCSFRWAGACGLHDLRIVISGERWSKTFVIRTFTSLPNRNLKCDQKLQSVKRRNWSPQ